jgi:hypothetical protein
MDGAEAAILQRALRYPHEAPERSFVLRAGRVHDADQAAVDELAREPLLAYGANCSPEMLAMKLGADPDPLLAERTTLRDHDVVYSAHVSLYGAVPATLAPSPGTEVAAFVLRLTPAQRRALDATEPNYEAATVAGWPAYLSRHGALELDGSRVALAAVPAGGRVLPSLDEREVLERVAATLAPGTPLERFVLDAAADPSLARRWTEALRSMRSAAG